MLLKYLGQAKRNGQYPQVLINGLFEPIDAEGNIEVADNSEVQRLILTGNFSGDGVVFEQPPLLPPVPEPPVGFEPALIPAPAPEVIVAPAPEVAAAPVEAAPVVVDGITPAPVIEPAKEPEPPIESAADKDALIAQARALGIPATRNWGVAKLQESIAEAGK
jgi:hypothetical protein